ncbi:hypothetical protein REPUB_Repub07fG0134900 [Reevesia pubescens]
MSFHECKGNVGNDVHISLLQWCSDKYLMKSLSKAAEIRGHSFWARGPDNDGSYNFAPHEIGFYRDGSDYDSYYGRFFLNWYSQVLVYHGDRVLALVNLAFEGTCIASKLSGIHWWYKTASHTADYWVLQSCKS